MGSVQKFQVSVPIVLADRDHSDAPSIARHHTLAEKRALIVTRRNSVPVGISTAVTVPVAAHESISNKASSVEAAPVEVSSVEAAPMGATAMEVATASTMEAAAPGTAALGRSQVCAGCSKDE